MDNLVYGALSVRMYAWLVFVVVRLCFASAVWNFNPAFAHYSACPQYWLRSWSSVSVSSHQDRLQSTQKMSFCSRIVDAIKHSCALLVVISIHQRSKCEFDHEYDRNFPSVTFPRLTRQFGKMTTSIFEQENVSHGKFTLYSCCQSCDAVIVLNGTLGKLYKSSCHGA